MPMGKFFVLEGLDGSGKTTVINRLREEFPDLLYTREPGGSIFGEKIRKVLLDSESKNVPALPLLLGFMSARASHFHEVIVPAVRARKTVVSDRFDASTFAFQLHGQEHVELSGLFWKLRNEILPAETEFWPRYIYLRMEPEVAEKRRRKRRKAADNETHFDMQTEAYHQRVFNGYEEFFEEINNLKLKMLCWDEKWVHRVAASYWPKKVYSKVKEIILNPSSP